MSTQTVYVPTRDEKARQDFVLGIKLLANGEAQRRVREDYRGTLLPQVAARLGREPLKRQEVEGELARSAAFRHWAVLTHRSQTMMWDAIEATTRRVAGEGAARMARLHATSARRGSHRASSPARRESARLMRGGNVRSGPGA